MRLLTDDDTRLVAGGADFTTIASGSTMLGDLVDYGSRELQGTSGWDGLTGPCSLGPITSTQWLVDDHFLTLAMVTGVQP